MGYGKNKGNNLNAIKNKKSVLQNLFEYIRVEHLTKKPNINAFSTPKSKGSKLYSQIRDSIQ